MKNKKANIVAWILQVILSLMFLMTGTMKAFLPVDQLASSLPWVSEVPSALVRFIGLSELLGGIGIILPSILKYRTKLTSLAALGLTLIMILASCFHIARGEMNVIGMSFILAALLALVAWLRLKQAPIQEKNSKSL